MLYSFGSCKTMAKTCHCTFESQILKNSLMSLTDSLPVLTALFADTIPRRPRHTTFGTTSCAKRVICHIITLPMLLLPLLH